MARYKPMVPFNVPMRLLVPLVVNVQGVNKKVYPDVDEGTLFFGSFRTFGGTELTSNEIYTVVDTARIDTWYRSDIKADCRIYLPETGDIYEIVATPENIEMRNQYLQIKVRKVGGIA